MPRLSCLFARWVAVVAVTLTSSANAESRPTRQETNKSTTNAVVAPPETKDLEITKASVNYIDGLELLVFEQTVAGTAGATLPPARGRLDGAPVLGYVFPTTLRAKDIGFGEAKGIVALVATAHPDFDDTPLWDEDGNGAYDDDGIVFHSHWVILEQDDRINALAVKSTNESSVLSPTNPGMPIYLDSPGFSVVLSGDRIRILVPKARLNGNLDFRFDAVTAYLEVNQSDASRPMLGVYKVYSVLSGDLSLPFSVQSSQ